MKNQKDIVEKVVDYIEKNIDKEIHLDHIAKNIGYSKFHLNRIFTEYTGITIYRYMQNRRLAIAAEKLVKTDQPIIQIAYEAGYGTQQSFSFAFKQAYLYSPKIYRDRGIFLPKQDRISMYCSYALQYYTLRASQYDTLLWSGRKRYTLRASQYDTLLRSGRKRDKFTTKIKEAAA